MVYSRYLSNIENNAKKISDLQKRLDYLKFEQKHFLKMGDTGAEHVKELFRIWISDLEMEINSLKKKKTQGDKEQITLEAMFANEELLNKLVKKLTEKSFCYLEGDTLKWIGIKHHIAKARASQLIALAFLCQPYYKKKRYLQKELQQAWTTYFNIYISLPMFSQGKRPGIAYDGLFSDIINSLRGI